MRNSYLQGRRWNIHGSTQPFVVLFFVARSAGDRLLEDYFVPLWLDLDSSEGLSKVSPFIFFTITAMRPSRVTSQPSFFNDSSLLKSRDFTEVEPGHTVHRILAFNTFLSLGWVKLLRGRQNLCIHGQNGRCEIA